MSDNHPTPEDERHHWFKWKPGRDSTRLFDRDCGLWRLQYHRSDGAIIVMHRATRTRSFTSIETLHAATEDAVVDAALPFVNSVRVTP